MPNRLSYPTENLPTNNGGEVLWSEGIISELGVGAMVSFMCAAKKTFGDDCPGRGRVRASRALRRGRKFRAMHEGCYRKIMGTPDAGKFVTLVAQPFRMYELPLPKGTVALYHTRAPGKSYMVAIKCRVCFDPHENNLKYVRDSSLRLYLKGCAMRALALVGFAYSEDKTTWSRVWPLIARFLFWDERCKDCARKRGSISRFTGWKTAPSGTKVYFPEDMDDPALVIYSLCKCEREVDRNNAINNYDELRAACRTHAGEFLDRLASIETLSVGNSQAQTGNGQTAQSSLRLDREKFLKRLRKFTVKAFEKTKPKTPSRTAVANEFAERGLRPTTGPGVRDDMNRSGVTEHWNVWVVATLKDAHKL